MAIGKSTALYGTPGKPHSKLPKGWARVKINDCVNILDKRRVPINSSERKKRHGSVPYYGATGQVGWIDDFLFNEELVLLGEDGAPFLDRYKNKAYVISGKSWVNNHAHVLQAVDAVLLNKFLCHFLNQVEYGEFVTGTTRLKLNQSKMKSISILLPPLAEQRRIVARVESIFARIDAARGRLERLAARGPDAPDSLAALRAGALKAAFEGRLVSQDPSDEPAEKMFEKNASKLMTDEAKKILPYGWLEIQLDAIASVISGQSPPSSTYNKVGIGLPFFQGKADFGQMYPVARTWCDDPKKISEKDDILISVRAPVGPTNISKEKCCIGRGLSAIRSSSAINNIYLFYNLRHLQRSISQKGTGTTFKAITQKQLRCVKILVPPLAEQRRIVARLESILGGIDVLQSGKNSEVSEGASMMSFCCTVSIMTLRTVRIWLTQHAFPLVFGLICLQTAGTSLICPPCGGTARHRDRPC